MTLKELLKQYRTIRRSWSASMMALVAAAIDDGVPVFVGCTSKDQKEMIERLFETQLGNCPAGLVKVGSVLEKPEGHLCLLGGDF